jgi:peptide/nickel transport system substrate-binding protein
MNRRIQLFCFFLIWLTGCSSPGDFPTQLRIQINRFPEGFSPIKTNEFDGLVFQFLTERDSVDKLVSNLVEISEKIAINDTITLFEFVVREDAVWADGVPVTREDVHFTLKLNKCGLRNDASSGKLHLDPVKQFHPDSSNERAFSLEAHGNPEYTRAIAGDFLVMPEHIFDPEGVFLNYDLPFMSEVGKDNTPTDLGEYFESYNRIPPYDSVYFKGSGPYQIQSYYPDQSITLSLTETRSRKLPVDFQLPEKISYLMISDPTAARFALQNNEVDIVTQIPASEFVQLEDFNKTAGSLNLYRQPGFRFVFFGFNTRQPMFSDSSVRIALSQVIDIQSIIDAVRLGYADPTIGPVHPVLRDLYNHDISPYSFNPERGKA